MMAWLEAGAGLIVAALVAVRWLGSHMRLIWRAQRRPRLSLTATVARPVPSARPLPGGQHAIGTAPRVIRGEVER
jgi:hypothetical protein